MDGHEAPGAGGRDEELLAELRRVASELDPVPPDVTAFAKAALDWRRVDAELAELLADTALDRESLAGTRSSPARSRSVTFQASELDIDLEIEHIENGILILGQLAPATRATVDAQRDDGSIAATTAADALGRFRVDLAAVGRIRLRITLTGGSPPRSVETSWLTI